MQTWNMDLDYSEAETNDETKLQQYLTFMVCDEMFAIDIMKVSEIKRWMLPTRLPNVPSYLLGVLNLRGVIVPVFDLRNRLGLGLTQATEKNAIIFLNLEQKTIGMLVDEVSDIINAQEEQITAAPKLDGKIKDEFLNGLINRNGQMIAVLNIIEVFKDTTEAVTLGERTNA